MVSEWLPNGLVPAAKTYYTQPSGHVVGYFNGIPVLPASDIQRVTQKDEGVIYKYIGTVDEVKKRFQKKKTASTTKDSPKTKKASAAPNKATSKPTKKPAAPTASKTIKKPNAAPFVVPKESWSVFNNVLNDIVEKKKSKGYEVHFTNAQRGSLWQACKANLGRKLDLEKRKPELVEGNIRTFIRKSMKVNQ